MSTAPRPSLSLAWKLSAMLAPEIRNTKFQFSYCMYNRTTESSVTKRALDRRRSTIWLTQHHFPTRIVLSIVSRQSNTKELQPPVLCNCLVLCPLGGAAILQTTCRTEHGKQNRLSNYSHIAAIYVPAHTHCTFITS